MTISKRRQRLPLLSVMKLDRTTDAQFNVIMVQRHTPRQTKLEMVALESLVAAENLRCREDAAINFGFIRNLSPGEPGCFLFRK